MHLQPVAISSEPPAHLRILMIGGIVLDQDGTLTAIVVGEQPEESQVGRSIEECASEERT
jgi:hypothetical protein